MTEAVPDSDSSEPSPEELQQLLTYTRERFEWTARRLEDHRSAARQMTMATGLMLALALTFLGLVAQKLPLGPSTQAGLAPSLLTWAGGFMLASMIFHVWLLRRAVSLGYVVGTPYSPRGLSKAIWKLYVKILLGVDLSKPHIQRPPRPEELLEHLSSRGQSLTALLLDSYTRALSSIEEAEGATAWSLGYLAAVFQTNLIFLILALVYLVLHVFLPV